MISIILPVYKDSRNLEKFMDKMLIQTSKKFELVIVVDTNNDKTLDSVEKYRLKFNNKIKLIFNSKRSSRSSAIYLASKSASGEYCIISTLQNSFNEKFVEDLNSISKEKKSDIIEFKAKLSSPIKFAGNIRKNFNKPVLIEDHPEIQAFTYPFDFNKIIKREILVKASEIKMPSISNSRFSIQTTFLSLFFAKTYSTVNKQVISSKSRLSDNFNPLKLIRQWEDIILFINRYVPEKGSQKYIYAQYFYEATFLAPLVKETKNKILVKKFNDKFKKQNSTIFKEIFEFNKFSNIISKERSVLIKNSSVSQFHKIHKELK